MKGLAPHTQKIIESVSRLECIKPYTLVGGTAQSLQKWTRQSEDLDFMKWRTSKNEKIEVTGPKIKIITFTDSKEQNKDLVTLTNDILNELINDGYHIIDYNVMNIYDPERSYSFIKYTT